VRRRGAALRARGLSGGSLRSVDLDAEPGEVIGITGATGSGHAELPYVLAGAVAKATGTVAIGDQEFTLPLRTPRAMIAAGVALVPEHRVHEGLALGLSAQENLTLPRAQQRGRVLLRADWQTSEFGEAVDMLGIVPAQQNLPCSSFSGGSIDRGSCCSASPPRQSTSEHGWTSCGRCAPPPTEACA